MQTMSNDQEQSYSEWVITIIHGQKLVYYAHYVALNFKVQIHRTFYPFISITAMLHNPINFNIDLEVCLKIAIFT